MKSQITRFIAGLAVVAVGVGFLLDNFNVYDFDGFMHDWWPLAIILAGLLIFINNVRNFILPVIIIGVGTLLELRQLGITDVNPWQVIWPAALVLIGLSIIFNRAVGHHKVSKTDRDDLMAVLGGQDQKNASDDYKGSKLTAVLGGIKLDLRNATIKKEATIEVLSFWGGVELLVPKDVVVKNQLSCIVGGVEDKTEHPGSKSAPILYITGDVIMAGVEIKNQP